MEEDGVTPSRTHPVQYHGETISLHEHIDSILDEQRRGMIVAEQERDKSAKALAATLAEQIRSGDQNLRDHIQQQVQQIRAALDSAEKLEVARFDALRREISLITEASAEAIAKAETANEKRFASVNEFRAQLADQTATFLPREVAEAQFAEMRRAIAALADKVAQVVA